MSLSGSSSASVKPRDLIFAILVIAIWGANAAIGKLAVPQIPALAFLAARFAITGILCLPFVTWTRANVIGSLKIALSLNVLHYGLIFCAMPHLDASALALIQQTQVPIAILLGWLFFRETISLKLGIGIIMGFAGLLVLKTVDTITPLGFSLAVAGGVAWAFANIEMKKQKDLPPVTFMALTTLFSVPFLAAGSLFYHEPVLDSIRTANWTEVNLVMAYQIFLGGAAFMYWKHLMTIYDLNKIVPLTLLQPLFGVIAGMMIFSEIMTGKMMIGGTLIIAGVALILIKRSVRVQTD